MISIIKSIRCEQRLVFLINIQLISHNNIVWIYIKKITWFKYIVKKIGKKFVKYKYCLSFETCFDFSKVEDSVHLNFL